jgi:mannose-6-phosphate isomerase-like protein (cupin superfamily)
VERVNISGVSASFSDHWSPRIVGELNGQHVKITKLSGEFLWHHHEHDDELFYVAKGRLRMCFQGREEILEPGDMLIVPHGVEHLPVAEEETWVMLFEPTSTLNTGNVRNERTVENPERL